MDKLDFENAPTVSDLLVRDLHRRPMEPHQVQILITLERVGGSISLVAVLCIFIAYALVKRVRNVQNTFIVFASISNIGASIACIIAMDGLFLGRDSSLCQAQAFMFEMFMQSDPWWSLAMAVNVYLVFFMRFSPNSFEKWWWLYCIICYGGPFTIALTLLFIDHPQRGRVYGEAELWCWVDEEWDFVRIYTYYMLIWICIVGSIICYVAVGWCVFQSRNRLGSLSTIKSRDARENQAPPAISESSNAAADGFYGTVITEVQVTHSNAYAASLPEPKKTRPSETAHVAFNEAPAPIQPLPGQYFSSVTASCSHRKEPPKTTARRVASAVATAASKFVIDDPIKRAYLRTSLLFALSVLVTWIPSSLNRIHSWMAGGSPFDYHVATAAVLPLQGLWNAVIFFITSWTALSNWWKGNQEERWEEMHENHHRDNSTAVRAARRDDLALDSDLEYGEYTGRLDSDAELRESQGKRSDSI